MSKTAGQIAFEAWVAHKNHHCCDGGISTPSKSWEGLNPNDRDAFEAAADAAINCKERSVEKRGV